jgi:hypothetical protein
MRVVPDQQVEARVETLERSRARRGARIVAELVIPVRESDPEVGLGTAPFAR